MLPHGITLSIARKLPNINKNGLEHYNMETCAYIWFTAIYGLTAIDNMLVVGWITRAMPTLIRQRRATCFTEIAQNAVLPFFESSLKCVCFCLITALFDYHWITILCEVEEQATYIYANEPWLPQQQRPPLKGAVVTNLFTYIIIAVAC